MLPPFVYRFSVFALSNNSQKHTFDTSPVCPLTGIETLPQELQRNFTVLRTLDQKTEDVKSEIDHSSRKYRMEVEGLNETERGKELSAIQDMFKKAIENSDNKVQMAMQMYEMVSDQYD